MAYHNNNNRNNKKQFRPNETEKQGLTVEVRNDDVGKALRLFKKKVQEDGRLQEVKERREYIKPSEKRARAKAAGRKRWLKTVEKKQAERGY